MRFRVKFTRLGHQHTVVVEAASAAQAELNVLRGASTMMSSPRIDEVYEVGSNVALTGHDHPAFRHTGNTSS